MTKKPLSLNPLQAQEAQSKLDQLKAHFETGQQLTPQEPFPAPQEKKAEPKMKMDQRQQQRQARKERAKGIQAALLWLQETYPHCFSKENPRPLKKRIDKDIFAHELPFPRILIRYTLAFYTRWHKYLKAVLEETHRYNLQGEQDEEITEAERAYALEKLKHNKERYNARKKKREIDSEKQEVKN